MKLEQIISFLEEIAPLGFQESYDNSGLVLGSPEAQISKVLICLDVDEKVMEYAVSNSCQLILSHHPAFFKAVKVFTCDTREGRLLTEAIRHDIALYSAHTNFDSALGGLTDLLCERIGLKNVRILKEPPFSEPNHGFGRYGEIDPTGGQQFINTLKQKLNLDFVRFVGIIPESISRVAVYNGSYDRSILEELFVLRPDVLITGDLKYHDAQELIDNRIFAIDAGHYGTEKLFVDEMASILEKKFPTLAVLRYEGSDVFNSL